MDSSSIVIGASRDGATAPDKGPTFVFTVRPTLQITPAAQGFAALSWTPVTSSEFALQYADALAPTNWFNAPSGEQNPVTLSLTNGAQFYRLFQP